MAGFSDAAKDGALQNQIASYFQVSLHTADSGNTGANEVAGGTYARVSTTWGTVGIPTQDSVTGSTVIINVPASTTIQFWGLWSPLLTAPASPAVNALTSPAGTFAAGTYFWKITGTNDAGETTGSTEVSVAVALNGSALLSWAALPQGTTGVNIYRGTATNAENVLVASLGACTSFLDKGAAGTAATVPASNTTQAFCTGGQLPAPVTYSSAGTYSGVPTLNAAG